MKLKFFNKAAKAPASKAPSRPITQAPPSSGKPHDLGKQLATLQAENASLRKQLEASRSEARNLVKKAAAATAAPDVNALAKAIVKEQEAQKNQPTGWQRASNGIMEQTATKDAHKASLEARYAAEKPSFDHLHGRARAAAAMKHRSEWLKKISAEERKDALS